MRTKHAKLLRFAAALQLSLLLLLGLWAMPVKAHVLKQDNGTGAVLHIPPEDSPQAKEDVQLVLTFYSQQPAFSLGNCACSVMVTDGGKLIATTWLQASGKSSGQATATIRFPRPAVYDVVITGTPKRETFTAFKLDYLVRVSPPASANATQAGEGIAIISSGSLIILVMIGYTFITRGKRYSRK